MNSSDEYKHLDAICNQKVEETAPKYTLSICAIFRNEARYLREWIEYHLIVGVDHFYLYSNNSTDIFLETLRPYIKEGVVTFVNWPDHFKHLNEENPSFWAIGTQIPAYENAAKIRALNETKWLVFLDVEEFLIPAEKGSFKELLEEYDDYPGITVSTDCFDASKLNATTGRRLLIETIELISSPEENPFKGVEKTIFKPREYVRFVWPPYKHLFKEDRTAIAVDRNVMRLNRYVNRFKGSLYFGNSKEKIDVDNRYLSENQMKELLQLGYEIEDQERAIFRFFPELQRRLDYRTSLTKHLED